jgi:hypothetical protein
LAPGEHISAAGPVLIIAEVVLVRVREQGRRKFGGQLSSILV